MNKQALLFYPLLGVVLLGLFVGGLAYGAVPIPLDHVMDILLGKGSDKIAWQNIVLQSRLPQAITALLAGASLATSGLLLQTLFRNPLAGPSILGISDGANLVAHGCFPSSDGTGFIRRGDASPRSFVNTIARFSSAGYYVTAP